MRRWSAIKLDHQRPTALHSRSVNSHMLRLLPTHSEITSGALRHERLHRHGLHRMQAHQQPAERGDPSMTAVLIVGASRGIGLEFVRQYRAGGAKVVATARGD